MGRLGQLLNAVILFLGACIAWLERRRPERPAAEPAAAGLLLPTDEVGPAPGARPVPAAGGPDGGGEGAATAPADADQELGERQSIAAEARFAPGFRTEIDEPASAPADAAAAETPAGAGPAAETTGAPRWAGVPAAAAPPARDLELATSPAATGPAVPAGAVVGDGTAACPDDHPIKGNASSMIYHQPGQPSYERTVAEYCFASVEAAEAAGYRAPRR